MMICHHIATASYHLIDGYGVFMEAIQNVTEVRVGANVFVRDIAHGDDIVLLIKRQDKK